MGFRFRRSVRVLPGLKVNIGKGGVTSASVGRRGLTTNINAKGRKTTFSVPGTGVSYYTDLTVPVNSGRGGGGFAVALFVVLAVLVAVLR